MGMFDDVLGALRDRQFRNDVIGAPSRAYGAARGMLTDPQFQQSLIDNASRYALIPNDVPVTAGLPDRDTLARMSLADIVALRKGLKNQSDQNYLGPYQHRAEMREFVGDNKRLAPGYSILIPGYTASKAVGLEKSRSQASLREIGQAYRGIWEGMTK